MKLNLRSSVLIILAANILMFILKVFLDPWFTNAFLLESADILIRPWILITSMFLHANFTHLLFNMWGLLIFGSILEQRIGPKRFMLVYIGSGLVAGLLASMFYDRALGASGAVMGMLGTLIILMPELKILFFFIIPMPLWVAGIVWALLDTLGIIYPHGVGNIAHLAGMATGVLYGLYLKKRKKKFQRKFSQTVHLDADNVNEYLKSGRL
ncbi:MAG: rhomboid family intramembrane serine protease [Nanoarchaeota archaeon]